MSIQIITTALPSGTTGVAYSQTISQTGGVAPVTFAVSVGTLPTSLALNAGTGVISGTPTVAGAYTFTIQATDDDLATDTQAYEVKIYDPLEVTPEPMSGDTVVYAEGGQQIQFESSGGSGEVLWSVTGGNLINPATGLFTAINGGTYTVTVTDLESGQVTSFSVVITSQSQFCVEGVSAVENPSQGNDTCCEFNVECNDRLQLRIPSFFVVEDGNRQTVLYNNLTQAVTGEASALRSTAAAAGANGNSVSFGRDAFYEIVTSYDMAQTTAGQFGIGWSNDDSDSAIESIGYAVVWYTDAGVRKIQYRRASVAPPTEAENLAGFPIAQGDAVTFGMIGGHLELWVNGVLVFSVPDTTVAVCGDMILDIGIENSGKSIGGYVTNLTWDILTEGTAGQVGTIDANGIYTSPSTPIAGIIRVVGTLNNANFYANVRNIKPTPRYTAPQAFLNGRKATIWVTPQKATDNDIIRIASDGTPDALQNPGMIDLGTLEASATFAEEITYQDFTNDDGIYDQAVSEEKATLTGSFLEVRDLHKLATIMQHATLFPRVKGVTELGVGGKTCGGCDLRVALIVEAGQCGSGWDVIYMPRAQNAGNLSLEIGKKTAAKQALNFRVLPDTNRPIGKQLYSIYQIANCSETESTTTCE